MGRLVLKKIAELIVVLFIVSIGTFSLMALIPGDAAQIIAGQGATPDQVEEIRQRLNLNDPFFVQYWDWLSGIFTGDFGQEITKNNYPVASDIAARLPVSVELAVLGLAIALVVAIPLAMIAARNEGGWVDRMIGGTTFGIMSVPSFVSGTLLILFFAINLEWFPRIGWKSISDAGLGQNLYHAILPAITVSLLELAMFTRILRGDLIATLRENFILVGKAKGMSTVRLLVSDALRPSSFSLITMLGISVGSLIGSTVIVEMLFGLDGMGSMIVNAASNHDMPAVQGGVLVIAVIYVGINAIIDISYGFLDPRSRRANV